jgi:hypothetical protein
MPEFIPAEPDPVNAGVGSMAMTAMVVMAAQKMR